MGKRYECPDCDIAVVQCHLSTAPTIICPDHNVELKFVATVETEFDSAEYEMRIVDNE